MYIYCRVERFDGSLFTQKVRLTDDILIIRNGRKFVSAELIKFKYFGKDYKVVDIWQD